MPPAEVSLSGCVAQPQITNVQNNNTNLKKIFMLLVFLLLFLRRHLYGCGVHRQKHNGFGFMHQFTLLTKHQSQ